MKNRVLRRYSIVFILIFSMISISILFLNSYNDIRMKNDSSWNGEESLINDTNFNTKIETSDGTSIAYGGECGVSDYLGNGNWFYWDFSNHQGVGITVYGMTGDQYWDHITGGPLNYYVILSSGTKDKDYGKFYAPYPGTWAILYRHNDASNPQRIYLNFYVFKNAQPHITITNPTSSSRIATSSITDIKWTWSGDIADIKIELWKGGVYLEDISPPYIPCEGSYYQGSYSWNIPLHLMADNDYQIKIIHFINPTIYDFSPLFEIYVPKSLKLISPNYSSLWGINSMHQIKWEWSGEITGISLELWKGDFYLENITFSEVPCNGSIYWRVPSYLQMRGDYQIKILDFSNSSISNFSPYFFIYNTSNISSKIFIDNDQGWASVRVAGNCTGNGTIDNPYIITEKLFDGQGNGTCLEIVNSTKYFEIVNCYLFNSEIGIKIINSTNFKIKNNIISNLYGIDGYFDQDGTSIIGISLDNVQDVEINFNKIIDLRGGHGGDATLMGTHYTRSGSGGVGGEVFGIVINNSKNINMTDNYFNNLIGGNGGNGQKGYEGVTDNNGKGGHGGHGGLGGNVIVIYCETCYNISNFFSNINSILGGFGGDGNHGGDAQDPGTSVIADSRGGNGGNGGQGGSVYGFYYKNSIKIKIINLNLTTIHAGNGGSAGNGGLGINPYWAGNGGIGGHGGNSIGLFIDNLSNTIIECIKISIIKAGNGSNGGKGGDGPVFSGYGMGGNGGNGGMPIGFLFQNSIGILNYNCIIYNVNQSYGGNGGFPGASAPASYSGLSGINRLGNGYYLLSANNSVFLNNIIFNTNYSLILDNSFFNNITGHTIINNSVGIQCTESSDNHFISNLILYNHYGIFINNFCYNNTFILNNIEENYVYGMEINQSTSNNIFSENIYKNNNVHVNEKSINNKWNTSSIGNYWDNYTGIDSNDDGIGDTPYSFGKGIDYLPIWRTAPNITIISPKQNQLFGNNTIDFELIIVDWSLNTTWYSVNNGLNCIFNGSSGKINQSIWNSCESGKLRIKFYANDSLGNIAWKEVIVEKDGIRPKIYIISPTPFQLFGNTTFTFNLDIIEPNLDTLWYTFDFGLNIYKFQNFTEKIDQDIWNLAGNGTIYLQFYANDTLGNIGFSQVIIRKSIYVPVISIHFPNENDLFSHSPTFNISIFGVNIDSIWYSIDLGKINITCDLSGQIEQSVWNYHLDGLVSLRFYTNNSIGYIGMKEIFVFKDTLAPISSISFVAQNKPNFVNRSTLFYLFADDEQGSGISQIFYKINNSDWIEYKAPFNLSNYSYGDYQIYYYAIDLAGNVEPINSITISLVNIAKQSHTQISGYQLLLINSFIVVSLIILLKRLKFNKL